MRYKLSDIIVRPHWKRRKFIIISFVIILVLLIFLPFLLVLANESLASYLHRELAYRHISQRITENSRNDFEKVVILNSFMFLNEEQGTPFIDVVDNTPYFDLVRSIGWCDQKVAGLVQLLEKQNIKARIVGFPSHAVTEVWIDKIPRLFDPTFNRYFVYENDRERIATLEDVLNDNDKLIMSNGNSFSEYEGKSIITSGDYKVWSILIDTKPLYKKMASKIMDFHYFIGGEFFYNLFQDFHFVVMEKFRGSNVVDSLGNMVTNERMLNEYGSEMYFSLYKARSYHLFDDFTEASRIYDNLLDSENFRDDALFFKAKILLQTKKFSELEGHIISIYDEYGEDIAIGSAVGTGGPEIRYSFFIKNYLEKFYSIENWQLEKIFNFTESEVNEVKTLYKRIF